MNKLDHLTLGELVQIIIDRMDPDELVDLLGLGIEELAWRLSDDIEGNRDRFRDIVEGFEEEELDSEAYDWEAH